LTGPIPHDDYLERVAEAEKMLAHAQTVAEREPDPVLTHRMDQLRAASVETRAELLERSKAMGNPHEINYGNDTRRMTLLLAGLLGADRCRHLTRTPAMPGLYVMPTRVQLCHPCADRAHRKARYRPPTVVPPFACDLCWGAPVEEFVSITVQLGPVLMVGDVCEACIDRLENA